MVLDHCMGPALHRCHCVLHTASTTALHHALHRCDEGTLHDASSAQMSVHTAQDQRHSTAPCTAEGPALHRCDESALNEPQQCTNTTKVHCMMPAVHRCQRILHTTSTTALHHALHKAQHCTNVMMIVHCTGSNTAPGGADALHGLSRPQMSLRIAHGQHCSAATTHCTEPSSAQRNDDGAPHDPQPCTDAGQAGRTGPDAVAARHTRHPALRSARKRFGCPRSPHPAPHRRSRPRTAPHVDPPRLRACAVPRPSPSPPPMGAVCMCVWGGVGGARPEGRSRP